MAHFFQDPTAWVLVSFIIFAAMAFKLGRGAILGKLDARIAEIKKEIAAADALKNEAEMLLGQYVQKQHEAAKEAQIIVETAKKQAIEIGRQAEMDIKETVRRREQQLSERLARMEQATINEIRAHAAKLAVKATAEIIAEKMDQSANDGLVSGSIAALGERLRG
jgi:F-type H+-transporting ATPase subunit b